jgi:glycosyltransferase involved in cell wall biosynthesis
MIYLAGFIVAFSLIRLLVVISNYRQWLVGGSPNDQPLVSVLIPARNEALNLGNILKDLTRQEYRHIEVWVYDDLSEDSTFEIAAGYTIMDRRFHVIRGKQLPAGWMGKNHACHCLAQKARGEYMLFLDADVKASEDLISSALAFSKRNKLDLLSLFPTQIMKTLAEWLTVPLMNWILVSLLPLALIRRHRSAAFSAANGQFMLFRSRVYRREQFHKKLRDKKVEDIATAQYMKQKGYAVATLLGNDKVYCRMYRSWDDSVNGFSRNVFYFFGNSKGLTLLFALITTVGFIPVVVYLPWAWIVIYIVIILLIRILVSLWSRQRVLHNILLAPLQQISLMYIIIYAFYLQHKRATRWKGRMIDQLI